jgi:hypothetical protein
MHVNSLSRAKKVGVRTSAWNIIPRGMENMFATTGSMFSAANGLAGGVG